MNIVKSRWRMAYPELYQKPPPQPDPEVASAKLQAELDADDVERLKARSAQLKEELDRLKRKLGVELPDWLIFLPASAGSPSFIIRACRYLESFRARIEGAGGGLWLDADHDRTTCAFQITKFKVIGGAVCCSGQFANDKFRRAFKGVSHENSIFMGDFDLCVETAKGLPPDHTTLSDLPAAARDAENVFGLAGAVCLDIEPGYGRSAIFRLK